MANTIIMPQKSMTLESNILSQWHKNIGDKIEAGDVVFSYETEKSSFDEVSPVSGVLLAQNYAEFDDVPVLSVVAIIGEENEDISDLQNNSASENSEKSPEIIATETQKKEESTATNETQNVDTINQKSETIGVLADDISNISPRAKELAESLKINPAYAIPTGPDGRIVEDDIKKLIGTKAAYTYSAYENTKDVAQSTGLGGRTRVQDYEQKSPQNTITQQATTTVQVNTTASVDEYKVVKLTGMRRAISKNMFSSLSTTAQLTHMINCDATDLMNFRKFVKNNSDVNITLNDMVSYAAMKVLKNHPALNSHFLDTEIHEYSQVHLGMAVDILGGLLVPTIRNASNMSLKELSLAIKESASIAKFGSTPPENLTGATFTISNVGSTGVVYFTPVLNTPQVALLGVGTIDYKVKPSDNDRGYDVYPSLNLSLTYDHRAVDGAPASRYLSDLCKYIENFTKNAAMD